MIRHGESVNVDSTNKRLMSGDDQSKRGKSGGQATGYVLDATRSTTPQDSSASSVISKNLRAFKIPDLCSTLEEACGGDHLTQEEACTSAQTARAQAAMVQTKGLGWDITSEILILEERA